MAMFTDAKGRQFNIRLTVDKLAQVREQCGIPLARLFNDPQTLADVMFCDPETAADVFWRCIDRETSCVMRDMTREEFFSGIDGPTIEKATEALLSAVVDFFPRSKIAKKLQGKLTTIFEAMDREIETRLDTSDLPTSISKPNAGSSPGLRESMPAHEA